ncbi:hypothetical protein GCM10011507_15570 [Edaphobacter acidisoli]|uniref:Uncharacterized protein n=1 Tax=Edaphobacter acidisoli TaxID=2040573 RepID=A0A916W4F9_9BACT|nr:hypothetical protein GCM10011507_15570 [Edaphobacter acidisoli]
MEGMARGVGAAGAGAAAGAAGAGDVLCAKHAGSAIRAQLVSIAMAILMWAFSLCVCGIFVGPFKGLIAGVEGGTKCGAEDTQ